MRKMTLLTGMLALTLLGWTTFQASGASTADAARAINQQNQPSSPLTTTPDKAWIARSNQYTQMLLDIGLKYSPEAGSRQGLAQYDEGISQPTQQNIDQAYAEQRAVVAKFQEQLSHEQDPNVKEDLQIMIHAEQLTFKVHDFDQQHLVSYLNASGQVYAGVQVLLDDQVAPERHTAAVVRLRKYAGLEPGYRPLVDILKERTLAQMARTNMIYPSKASVETELARNARYIQGIQSLFEKYGLSGWQEPFATIKTQVGDYDAWVKATVLPKARTDFREPPELYAMILEEDGVDVPPAELAEEGHQAFKDIQAQMQTLAVQVAKEHGWPDTDYHAVIKRLKQDQLTGEAILPFYEQRLKQIEQIIVKENIATLPQRPARIRLGTPAENATSPAPHMVPAPLLNNTGQQGEFVLPLNMPAAPGATQMAKPDDYTYDAASWTLIAHEARPGHELAFDTMVERGVSHARALYGGNTATTEGWGLYAESLIEPYMPPDGQLVSLQFRLLRAARAFLDPELQTGKITRDGAMSVLTNEVVMSEPFATEEVERYTIGAPGQATSYFYGYEELLQLRKDTEAALGPKFNLKKYHDFILDEGMLHMDLLRQAVTQIFIPEQKAA
jgi:hypothetical protein